MPRKRDVLEQLKRDELLAAADRLDVPLRDRRGRDGLIEALATSRKAGLDGILEGLSRDRLKEVCRALDLDDSGREKAATAAAPMPDREDIFAEMRPYMEEAEGLDDSREAVYTRGEGEGDEGEQLP